uniref:Uncharacterized protein n=1 Tax=Arundo donax TaxID=35708 RepID=A0A0A9A8L6_ARUDO
MLAELLDFGWRDCDNCLSMFWNSGLVCIARKRDMNSLLL